jgi:hypothetical protein
MLRTRCSVDAKALANIIAFKPAGLVSACSSAVTPPAEWPSNAWFLDKPKLAIRSWSCRSNRPIDILPTGDAGPTGGPGPPDSPRSCRDRRE